MHEEIKQYWHKLGYKIIIRDATFYIYVDYLRQVRQVMRVANNIPYYFQYSFTKNMCPLFWKKVSEEEMISYVRLQAFL